MLACKKYKSWEGGHIFLTLKDLDGIKIGDLIGLEGGWTWLHYFENKQ